MRSCESLKSISEGLIVKAIEAEINVRKRYRSDVRLVNKKGKRERLTRAWQNRRQHGGRR